MEDIVSKILWAATDDQHWFEALDAVCWSLGAPAGVLFLSDDLRMNSKASIFSDFWRHDERAALTQLFDEEQDVVEDRQSYNMLASMPTQELLSEQALFRAKGLDELPASKVRTKTLSYGFTDRVVCVLNRNGPWIDLLTLQVDDNWKNSDVDAKMLIQVMSSAMQTRHILRETRLKNILAFDALNLLNMGIFALRGDGSVVFMNDRAQRMLDQKDGVSNIRGRLAVAEQNESRQRFVIEPGENNISADVFSHKNKTRDVFLVPRRSSSVPLIGKFEVIGDVFEGAKSNDRYWALFLLDLEEFATGDSTALAKIGDLTAAEAEVLALITKNISITEIAQQRGRSVNTIRNQLTSIMSKLRCSSQKELAFLNGASSLNIVR